MRSHHLFRNEIPTPLGRLSSGGLLYQSPGIPRSSPRVLGSYALVMLTQGSGYYADAHGEVAVAPGDLIVVFPEIAHTYGPQPTFDRGGAWDEWHFVFDGPAFDLWRAGGLLDATRPVRSIGNVEIWRARAETFILTPPPITMAARTRELARFLEFVTELLTAPQRGMSRSEITDTALNDSAVSDPTPRWLEYACALLERDFDRTVSLEKVAQEVGLSYENFRKKFAAYTGTSPARYRMARRVDAACALLVESDWTQRAIAYRLGFRDEFHFARCFKSISGVAPGEFRRHTPRRQG